MKLRTQLSVLHPEMVIRLWDANTLDLVLNVKYIPKELKERNVKSLNKSYSDSQYDLFIELKV